MKLIKQIKRLQSNIKFRDIERTIRKKKFSGITGITKLFSYFGVDNTTTARVVLAVDGFQLIPIFKTSEHQYIVLNMTFVLLSHKRKYLRGLRVCDSLSLP